jgi:SAM-dependent methyltransferase
MSLPYSSAGTSGGQHQYMDTNERSEHANAYVLGHSSHELARLSAQARLYAPFMLSFFHAAGIEAGMHVLDVGCGGGDVSLLMSSLVGPTGLVVGIDPSTTAIETASRRAGELGISNMRSLVGDATVATAELAPFQPFDAAVGRSVLEFVPDPVALLRNVAALVRPRGVIAFQEVDWSGCRAHPQLPSFSQCVEWGVTALKRSGADPYIGLKLFPIFTAAGLSQPTLSLHAAVGAGPNHPLYAHVAGFMRTLLPTFEALGVATAEDVDIETLERRVNEEAVAMDATLVWVSLIGAFSRTHAN